MKKYVIGLIVLVVCVLVVGTVVSVRSKHQNDFASYVMKRLGGDMALKKKCMDSELENVKLSDGKILTRQITGNDLARVSKMCDCVVAKSYQHIIKNKKQWADMMAQDLSDEIVDALQRLLLINYQVCVIEMQDWLDKRYKTIRMNNE